MKRISLKDLPYEDVKKMMFPGCFEITNKEGVTRIYIGDELKWEGVKCAA